MFFESRKCLWILLLSISALLLVGQAEGALSLKENIGVWLLDEGSGKIAEDSGPNNYDGELKGGKWIKRKFGGAIEFKKGDTVTIPLGKGSMRNKASVIMWLLFTDVGAQQNYFSAWDQSNNRLVRYKDAGNMLRCWSNNWNIASGVQAKKDQWYHVANVYDGKKAKIYIDGKEKVSQDVPKFELADQPQTAWLATDKGGWVSACSIDEAIFFSRAVTADEVNDIFTKGFEGALRVDKAGKLPTVWANLKRK